MSFQSRDFVYEMDSNLCSAVTIILLCVHEPMDYYGARQPQGITSYTLTSEPSVRRHDSAMTINELHITICIIDT